MDLIYPENVFKYPKNAHALHYGTKNTILKILIHLWTLYINI